MTRASNPTAAIRFVMQLRGMKLLAALSRLYSLAESGNPCAPGSCQSEPTLEARTDRNVKLSASSYFEEARTLSRSLLLKNTGEHRPLARRLHMDASVRTGAGKVESRGTTQSTFMPSTMNAVRIHGRGGPEFLKYYEDGPIPQLVPDDALARVHATGISGAELL